MYTTNLPDYSKHHMLICGLFLSKTREQKLIFQIGTLNPHGIDQQALFIPLIYSCFPVTIFQPIA